MLPIASPRSASRCSGCRRGFGGVWQRREDKIKMAAYIIVDVDVKNAKAYESYKHSAAASIAQYGGRYLVRGGTHEVLEGEWHPTRLVVLEFPSVDAAKRWYTSPEYADVKPIRLEHAVSDMVLVDGV
jgi:uncharacterized protein (DUF1330 family)